jgi:hypothetical protein
MDIKDVLVNVGMLFLVAEPETNCWLFGVNKPGVVSENNEGLFCKPCIIVVGMPYW